MHTQRPDDIPPESRRGAWRINLRRQGCSQLLQIGLCALEYAGQASLKDGRNTQHLDLGLALDLPPPLMKQEKNQGCHPQPSEDAKKNQPKTG